MHISHSRLVAFCFVALSGLSCCHAPPSYAWAIPGKASRSPDLSLPLSAQHADFALVFLATPESDIPLDEMSPDDFAEHRLSVDREAGDAFAELLAALRISGKPPALDDLSAHGSIGRYFEPRGAPYEGIDSRFRFEVLEEDIVIGTRGSFAFAFYRRFPTEGFDEACPGDDRYCKLVIFPVAAARR